MKHLPRMPGKPESLCGGEFPSTTIDIAECDCQPCLWQMVAMFMTQLSPALARLMALGGVAPRRRSRKEG